MLHIREDTARVTYVYYHEIFKKWREPSNTFNKIVALQDYNENDIK